MAIALGAEMVSVPGGTYRPVYPSSPEEAEIAVAPFAIDATPVTNAEYRRFVQDHPKWVRGAVPGILADARYLAHWDGTERADAPVTHVSWFAGRAYCEARGARLPTEAEWELVAAASEDHPYALDDPAFAARILAWYGRPGSADVPVVGQTPSNFFGVRDLHGVVWEWVEDFNSALVSVDNREDGGADRTLFCGAGALAAADKGDYAAFMRIAFRSSLRGETTTRNLGFRCARGTP